MYTNQSVKVRCVNSQSAMAYNKVVFAVNTDELLIRLKESNVGCHIGHLLLVALAYADDVSLIAPTRHTIMKMLEKAIFFSVEFKIKFDLSI